MPKETNNNFLEEQKETAYKYFKKGYQAAIERLEQKDKDLRVDFLDYWEK